LQNVISVDLAVGVEVEEALPTATEVGASV
jgi:hypothetical protein